MGYLEASRFSALSTYAKVSLIGEEFFIRVHLWLKKILLQKLAVGKLGNPHEVKVY